MMSRTLCLLFMAGLAAARPSVGSSIMYVIPGNYYPYSFGPRSLEGEPITNIITPEEASGIEQIKTPEITEPILHLGGVPEPTVETKEVEEPIKEVEESEILDIETTPEILPAKETEAEVTEKIEIVKVPEESLIIAEEFTEAPLVEVEKDKKKNLTGTVIPALSVLVKPLSEYSQYLPSWSWLSNLSSWWPFRYGGDSRFYNRYY